MQKTILLIILLSAFGLSIHAQKEKCATMSHWQNLSETDPEMILRKNQLEIKTQNWIDANKGQDERTIVTIPVVVHVVYHTGTENISDSQINSQMIVLNEDFRKMNSDTLSSNHPFYPLMADCDMDFCLATQDPQGETTTGITRTFTDSTSFSGNDNEKFNESGGKDNWDPTKYLNVWVCNLGGTDGTLGYATFPSELSEYPEYDGVVIDYRVFGTEGTAGTGDFEYNDLGRTATHEVGHWLNLSHIWGDEECGDDKVDDTPPAVEDNFECPSFPHNANSICGTDENGEMFMNFMDYTDDECMAMFSNGQSKRMEAAVMNARSKLLNSTGCSTTTGITNLNENSFDFQLYPNPSLGYFYIDLQSNTKEELSIRVMDALGKTIYQSAQKSATLNKYKIDIGNQPDGIYIVSIQKGNSVSNEMLIINE